MFLETINVAEWVVTIHWTGMLLGLGSAAVADALGARVLLSSRPGPPRVLLLGLHLAIWSAILLVLLSGTSLIVLRADRWCELPEYVLRAGPVCLPYKVAVKLMLFAVLISVALLIETWLLPLSRRNDRPLLVHLSAAEIVRSASIVMASFTCWTMLALVPQVKVLQTIAPLTLLAYVVCAWMAAAATASAALLVLRQWMRWIHGGSYGVAHPSIKGAVLRYKLPPAPHAESEISHGARVVPLFRVAGDREHGHPRPSAAPVAFDHARPPAPRFHARGGNAASAQREAFMIMRSALPGTMAVSFVINLLMLSGPLYMLQVYDRVLTSRSVETLFVLTMLVAGLFAVMGVLDVVRARILTRVALRLDLALAPHMLAAAIKVEPLRPRAASPSPPKDLEQIRQFLAGAAPQALLDLPYAPLYFALVFLLHPLLGIIALCGAGVLVMLSILNQLLTRRPLAAATEASTRCDELAAAGARGAEALHALGMGRAFRIKWLDEHVRAQSAQRDAADRAGTIATTIRVTRLLLQSLLLGAGAWLALRDAASAGAMIAASIISARALAPIEQIVAQWRSIGGLFGAVARCRACLSQKEAGENTLELPAPRGALVASNIFVSAPGAAQPILKGISFRLEPGDAMAVIGPSATGKSTLARALVGIWPVRHGDLRLDDAALGQWGVDDLGRHLGYLPQEATLFDGTIAENIARLEADADPQAVISAAHAAGVHEMILRLPSGYATRVGAGGGALSGGQRQRIALARALYRDPALVVMDEPNANLDQAGEAALVETIVRLRAARRTVVVMAHRRSVLAAVNKVLVLRDGRQVAMGAPNEVLRGTDNRSAKGAINDNRKPAVRSGR